MAFIMLRFVPSITTLVRVFIVNGCWTLSNAFSAPVEVIIYMVLIFLLVMWCIMSIGMHMLYHHCEPG